MNTPKDTDQDANFDILENFERFHQKNEMFRRSQWDKSIRNEKTERFYSSHGSVNEWRRAEGFRQQDYALRNAAWHISDVFTDVHNDKGRREGFTDIFTLQADWLNRPTPRTIKAVKQVCELLDRVRKDDL